MVSNTTHTGCLLVILQAHQHLPHSLLAASFPTPTLSLPTQIHQFCNALPTRASSRRVLSLCQKLLRLLANLCFLAVDFAIVGFVEAIDIFLCCGDSLFFLLM